MRRPSCSGGSRPARDRVGDEPGGGADGGAAAADGGGPADLPRLSLGQTAGGLPDPQPGDRHICTASTVTAALQARAADAGGLSEVKADIQSVKGLLLSRYTGDTV